MQEPICNIKLPIHLNPRTTLSGATKTGATKELTVLLEIRYF